MDDLRKQGKWHPEECTECGHRPCFVGMSKERWEEHEEKVNTPPVGVGKITEFYPQGFQNQKGEITMEDTIKKEIERLQRVNDELVSTFEAFKLDYKCVEIACGA